MTGPGPTKRVAATERGRKIVRGWERRDRWRQRRRRLAEAIGVLVVCLLVAGVVAGAVALASALDDDDTSIPSGCWQEGDDGFGCGDPYP